MYGTTSFMTKVRVLAIERFVKFQNQSVMCVCGDQEAVTGDDGWKPVFVDNVWLVSLILHQVQLSAAHKAGSTRCCLRPCGLQYCLSKAVCMHSVIITSSMMLLARKTYQVCVFIKSNCCSSGLLLVMRNCGSRRKMATGVSQLESTVTQTDRHASHCTLLAGHSFLMSCIRPSLCIQHVCSLAKDVVATVKSSFAIAITHS